MIYAQIQAAVEGAIRQTSTQVIQDMGIEQLANKLLGIPGGIRKLQDAVIMAQKDVDLAKNKVETAKSIIVAMVTSTVNENGKPVYSNETARNAEITRRMADDPDYLVAKQELLESEEKLANLRFEIERLNSEMANLRAVINARAAQVQALFGS